ncbi:cingulin-like isoform X1 [Centruroides vittatus]|uniref:cingulin-like isoform X1 n=1 Tax=Centruroides vittatus TaxID=120091 RepID=UPI00350EFF27
MVTERPSQDPGPEVARDVGYSSDDERDGSSEVPGGPSAIEKIPGEMDGSCDASGEYTTDDSDDQPPTRVWAEAISCKRDGKGPEWRRISSGRRRGRPRSMTELYQRKSPDVTLFASNAELSAWPMPGSLTKLNSARLRTRWRRSRSARSTFSGGSEGCARDRSSSASSDPEDVSHSPSSDLRVEDFGAFHAAPPTAEETSSISDQVWDGYQDPLYLSESYTESTVDQEEFRKVTEFGDDYDDLMEAPPPPHPPPLAPEGEEREQSYTDSDEEDFLYVIDQATRALHVARSSLADRRGLTSAQKAELIATCRAHLHCLLLIDDHLSSTRENARFDVRGLIEKWETMENELEPQEEDAEAEGEKRGEEEESQQLRENLEELDRSVRELESEDYSPAPSFDRLEEKIDSLQVSLRALQETRERLLAVNLRVRRRNDPSLPEKVTESYRLWEGVYRRNRDLTAELRLTRNLWSRFLDLSRRLENSSPEISDQERDRGLEELRALVRELEQRLEGSPALPGIREASESLEPEARRPKEQGEEEEEKAFEGPSEIRPDEEEEDERKKKPSLLRRVLRVAVPVQLALVLLYCLARLLEPRCCDSVNNLHFSTAPQLRYVRGPPPL